MAQRTVCGEQRGFVSGRQLADKVIAVEGGLVEFTQLADCLPAILLLDFSQAFPSLSHVWMFAVFDEIEQCPELRALIFAMYTDLLTPVHFSGCSLGEIRIATHQARCLLSGSAFAIAADPLIRAYLAATTICSSRIIFLPTTS